MRIEVPLHAKDHEAFNSIVKRLGIGRSTVIRLCISIGLKIMYNTGDSLNDQREDKCDYVIRFNTTTIDPYRVFEIVAYGILCRRLGYDGKDNRVIIADKKDFAEILRDGFVIGLHEIVSKGFESFLDQGQYRLQQQP